MIPAPKGEQGRSSSWGFEGSQPVYGPEWLVFSPAGELVARLDVSLGLRVLGFGDGVMLATGYNGETRLFEVYVYELTRAE